MSTTTTHSGFDLHNFLGEARQRLAQAVSEIFKDYYGVDIPVAEVAPMFARPAKPEQGDFGMPCFALVRKLNTPEVVETLKARGEDGVVSPISIAAAIASQLSTRKENNTLPSLTVDGKCFLKSVTTAGAYLNIILTMGLHGKVISDILTGTYLNPLSSEGKDRVMIEYSQPNTHKAFHVGHMRNAALGDCLVRLYEQVGHPVVAVNYFGDEGAHVAKCLWFLQNYYMPKAQELYAKGIKYDEGSHIYAMKGIEDIDIIPVEERAEWLGDLYTKAVDMLDIRNYTSLPYPIVIAAKVLSKEKHPHPEAPANWNVVKVQIGPDAENDVATVVCGGAGYEVGDVVAYLPVGKKLTKKMGVVEPKDMKGIMSCGVMLAERELGSGGDADDEGDDGPADVPESKEAESKDASGKKAGGKAKAKASAPADPTAVNPNSQIKLLPSDAAPGISLVDVGKLPDAQTVDGSVLKYHQALNKEAGDVLLALENDVHDQVALWRRTGQWSLDAFKEIYKWLDCRFDHDFTESEVSEPSRLLVNKFFEEGKLEKYNGAVVMDLTAHNLGRCTLLKSNGAGLYATKDLALATRKFDQFHIDKSIYIVDAAQTYHFQQVFKTLELLGYPQAKKCVHLPYGLVVLPSGRMSSRKGNVMLFSQLRSEMNQVISAKLSSAEGTAGGVSNKDEVIRRLAVSAIKYGMLNHDLNRDIVFELDKWTNNTGNTGPYLLYAYTRIMSIFQCRTAAESEGLETKFDILTYLKNQFDIDGTAFARESDTSASPVFDISAFLASDVSAPFVASIDYDAHLDQVVERAALMHLHKFWESIPSIATSHNPSALCDYTFQLAQLFSTWYQSVRLSKIERAAIASKLTFIAAIAKAVQRCLFLLGITTVDKM